ncbi:MAG: cysteine--tRNA ligase, partial [Chlamydiia bacterium]|nr:cysteine--tRNA ligase [Chlamydiia bacterium]
RPGWHIECSAMATYALGPTIDLHCGGVDNIFPHHENEIAQSEGATGVPFSRRWAHAQHLIVDGKKMSKSLGNFYRLKDLLDKGYTGLEIRYLLLSTHYRTQLNFTLQGLDAARASLQRLASFFARLKTTDGQNSSKVEPLLDQTTDHFNKALADDLGISVALAALFEAVRQLNAWMDAGEVGATQALTIIRAFQSYDQALGVLPIEEEKLSIPPELTQALEQRQAARKNKDWAEADRLRDFIHESGYLIEDSPHGPTLKKA